MRRAGGLLALLWMVPGAIAGQGLDAVPVRVSHVAGPVFLLQGAGGNVASSIGPDGILMVDADLAPLSDRIRAELARLAGDGADAAGPRFLVDTHWHEDHTGGNVAFAPPAVVIAHANTLARLSTPQTILGQTVPPLPEASRPVVVVHDSLSVHLNGEEVRVIHAPAGHTDGDVIVRFVDSNVVHMGDDFFNGVFPFVDLDAGGSVEGLAAVLDDVLEWIPGDARIIPGHGPVGDVDDLRDYRRMVAVSIAFVREGLEDGMPLDELRETGLPAAWDSWSNGFVSEAMWLGIVYRSLVEGDGGDPR